MGQRCRPRSADRPRVVRRGRGDRRGQPPPGGATVLADAVNPVEAARSAWRELATAEGVPLRVVEVVCSDPAEHRRRVEARLPGPDQRSMPTWAQVEAREYEPWIEPRLTVDTVNPAPVLVEQILTYVRT